VDWGFPLRATWAKDLGAYLGAWDLVAIFAGVGLAVAVLASEGRGGALDTTGAGVGMFWEGVERLVEGETLPLPLLFLLVTVVKGASSTAGWSTATALPPSISEDDSAVPWFGP